ncbi:hypothetical protein [Parachlamydia sp. AcF125]|uniref:hypothetical protein n=1 Tax=Parachlamydia sp. AcF125 TaxID=2795736 RepID=UPI001BC90BE1|nr:hypothetical protein [Parachlamydia sp. AcF125]
MIHYHCHFSKEHLVQHLLAQASEQRLRRELKVIQTCLEFFSSQIRSSQISFSPKLQTILIDSFKNDYQLFEAVFEQAKLQSPSLNALREQVNRLFFETMRDVSNLSTSPHVLSASPLPSSTPTSAIHYHPLSQLPEVLGKTLTCRDFLSATLKTYTVEQKKSGEKENEVLKRANSHQESKGLAFSREEERQSNGERAAFPNWPAKSGYSLPPCSDSPPSS